MKKKRKAPTEEKARMEYDARKHFRVHAVLIVLVLLVMVGRLVREDYYSVFLCVLTLILFNIPLFVDRTLNIRLPTPMVIIIMLFVFAAEILGEIGSFYTYVPWWDTMLHTTNGFLMAAIGFALIDILNKHPRFHISLSPLFVAFVAFCFSMTVGVVWEFFEFGMDRVTGTDMQKDFIVESISSVKLNPEGVNSEVKLPGVTKTVIYYTQDGQQTQYTLEGGYLDLGIIDTMKDLIVNCIGAVTFSVIGYFYMTGKGKGLFAQKFIPRMKTQKEIEEENEIIEDLKQRRRTKRKEIKEAADRR